uniref:BTB domain-containing protein n=1 Tax=Branchiostoma floridae TaxID=7739 RepID=C3XXN7_BRAFL|eukprot:XP_002611487.1 hypothetical protein BRAFLDRAFT_63878 [Branchiostoma floridae]
MAAADQEPHVSEVCPRSFQDNSYRDGFLGTVADLQKAGVLQDVVIEVEDHQFPCHRLVLSAASPYFRAMFTSGMAESRQETVVLQGLDAGMFEEILSYIYTGTVRMSLDKVQPMYQAADLLQLDYVRDTCSSYMVMSLASSTCVDMYNFADAFSVDMVLNRCRQWVCRHFAKLIVADDLSQLIHTQPAELFTGDKLWSSNEILYMNPRAGKYISCSYDCESLRSAEAITVTSNNDIYILAEEPEDPDHLHLLEYNHAGNMWERARPPSMYKPEKDTDLGLHYKYLVEADGVLYYLYVVSRRIRASVWIRKYNWQTDQWQECSRLKLREADVEYMTTLSCGPHLYFLQNTDLHRYDPDQDRWCKLTPPKVMPHLYTAAALGAEIFCADHEFTKAMVYHTESDCWQILRGWRAGPMYMDHIFTPNFFVLENQLYLLLEQFNGIYDTAEDSLIFVYDRASDAWSSRGLRATLPIKDVDKKPVSEVCPRSYQDDSYRDGFLGTVGDLQKAGVLQDVIIEVEDHRFPCHRLVLSAASPYFRAMFTSGMAESRQETVVLQGLDEDMFEEILSYIYTGTVHVSLNKVQPLYQAADLLQLDYVRDTCSSYMAMSLASSTCVDMYNFAGAFSVDIVLLRCRQWICRHFAKFVSSEEFCRLSVNQLTEIISHDELDVKEETTVWEAVVRWVQHSREDRLDHLDSILHDIRFSLLTSDDTAAILNHPLVRDDAGRTVIANVVKESSNYPRRIGMDSLEMALVFCTSSNEILYMNPRAGKYISCSYDCESLRSAEAITVTSNNDIYILAEEPEDPDHLHVLEYNHAGNMWERARPPSMYKPEKDTDLGLHYKYLVEADGVLYYLYVVSRRISASVWIRKYNWQTDQWQECSQLQLREADIEYMTILSCGPHLYFLQNTEMHRYDPDQDRWCKRTPPRMMPHFCTASAWRTEIFCAEEGFDKAMVYYTESDRWQRLRGWMDTGNSEICYTPNFFVLENQLYLLLERLNTTLDTEEDSLIFVYDRASDAWSSRGLRATLPIKDVDKVSGLLFPVARMYLPCLKGEDK